MILNEWKTSQTPKVAASFGRNRNPQRIHAQLAVFKRQIDAAELDAGVVTRMNSPPRDRKVTIQVRYRLLQLRFRGGRVLVEGITRLLLKDGWEESISCAVTHLIDYVCSENRYVGRWSLMNTCCRNLKENLLPECECELKQLHDALFPDVISALTWMAVIVGRELFAR